MSRMYDIYARHADRYDELVRAEDHRGNLAAELRALFRRPGGAVLEAGVGTGRVTRLYIDAAGVAVCCDRSPHMIAFAREALRRHAGKIDFRVADNEHLPALE
jgi:ubiquinone/menaquinone biosynthesis C-methylase UbiE